jgi:DNA topoisomerase-1
MEELGIGRPSTYASILQVLKDRAYVRIEKNRFFAEESGRLLTGFLERFFERYVAYDYTAGLEDELDEVSGGARRLASGSERILAGLQTQDRRGDGAKAV